MARRQRCVSCRKLFTPNYRNRTKVAARQRVCADCGAIVGHRLADQRYRSSGGAPRRARDTARPAEVAPGTASGASSPSPGDADQPLEMEPLRLVHAHLAAIAALVEASASNGGHGHVSHRTGPIRTGPPSPATVSRLVGPPPSLPQRAHRQ